MTIDTSTAVGAVSLEAAKEHLRVTANAACSKM